jgi:hypothetical protein
MDKRFQIVAMMKNYPYKMVNIYNQFKNSDHETGSMGIKSHWLENRL